MSLHNPPHPGEFTREVYLEPFAVSSRQLASSLGGSPSTLSRLLKGISGVSPEMSLRLSRVLGRLSRELAGDAGYIRSMGGS